MGNRKGKKSKLFLSARRRKNTNLKEYIRCKKAGLPYLSKRLLQNTQLPQEMLAEDNKSVVDFDVFNHPSTSQSCSNTRKQILKQGRSNSGKQVYSEIQLSEFNSAETLETIKQEQLESLDTAITIKEEPLECNPVNIAITASENVCVMDNCISVKAEPDFIDIKQETDEDQATQTWQSTMEEKPHPIDQDVPTELDRFDLIFQDLAKRFKQFSSSRQITVINTLCSVIAKAEIEEREEQS